MAEAAVEQRPNRYFCHQCSVKISPNLPDFTCPRCQSGFIEEMTEEFDETQNAGENDPAAQFAELWGRTFLESFRLHTDLGEGGTNQQGSDNEEEREESAAGRGNHYRVFPARVAVARAGGRQGERHLALEGIIQQLLGSLAGTAFMRGGPSFNLQPLHSSPGDYAWGAGGLDAVITQLLNQLEGTGPPPARKEQIDQLPTVTISQEDVANCLQCSICMEEYKLDESVRQLPCKHSYHAGCIVPWLQQHGTCPVCRKNLDGEDTSTQEHSPFGGSRSGGSSGSSRDSGRQSVYDFSEDYE